MGLQMLAWLGWLAGRVEKESLACLGKNQVASARQLYV